MKKYLILPLLCSSVLAQAPYGTPGTSLVIPRGGGASATNVSGGTYDHMTMTDSSLTGGFAGTASGTFFGDGSGLSNVLADGLSIIGSNAVYDIIVGTTLPTNQVVLSTNGVSYNQNIISPIGVPTTENNVLIIDNVEGDDTIAAANPYKFPWKTAYDVYNTNGWIAYGALTAAKPNDTILFRSSSNAYLVPSIPLAQWGSNVNGANLIIELGATLIRTNFLNTNATQLDGNQPSVGPLIIPGNNSRIIVDGIVIATNTSSVDSTVGWLYSNTAITNILNNSATNVYVGGSGWLYGKGDCVLFQSGQIMGSGFIENLHIRSSYDAANNNHFNHITRNLDVVTVSENNNTDSRGWVVWDGQYADFGSRFEATCGTNSSLTVAGISLENTSWTNTVRLHNTKLIVHTNANGTAGTYSPLYIPARKAGSSTLACGIAAGEWIEQTDTNTVVIISTPTKFSATFSANTNVIVASGAGTSVANLTYQWDTLRGSYTNANNNITNDVAGAFWTIRAGPGGAPAVRYFSTNSYVGPYWTTNTGSDPPPTTVFPTNTAITKTPL